MEMAGEFLDDPDVGFYGTLSVITSLEFLQHHSAKMGHKDTSCDHNLSPCQATIARFTSREASAAPAAWFKRACVDLIWWGILLDGWQPGNKSWCCRVRM